MLAAGGLLTTLIYRRENYDDAWFGELAYFLATEGVIRSGLFADMLGWGDQVLMTHKLLVVLTALWIKIWGFSLYTVKTVALPFVALQVFLFYRYCRQSWMLCALLYLSCGVIVRYTFVSRPEIAMAALGFLSWQSLQQFRENGRIRWLLLAGMSAGATALFHLQGAVFMSAGAVWLLWARQFRGTAIYSAVAFGTFLLYFTDVVYYDAWDAYFFQIANDPATTALRSFSEKLFNLAEIPKIMLHSGGETPLTLVMLGCLFLRWKSKLPASDLEKYLLVLALCFAVLANRMVHEYLILFVPFMIAFSAETLDRMASERGSGEAVLFPKTVRWMNVLVILYLVAGVFYDGKLLYRNLQAEPLSKRNARLSQIVGDEPTTVIAPQSFIFGNIERHHIIGLGYYHHYNSYHTEPLTPEVFFEDAKRKGVRFVIFERNPITAEYKPPEDLPEVMADYRLIHRDERFRVYQQAPE
ncbi:MAG TPA: hypothetical protein EYM25_02295 [Deltaproteobacteria bacterium]|nr:hypothetical protein [Deltaproteobacteria bacterium]